MLLTLVLAFAAMLLPAGIGLMLGKGVYFAWSMASLYVFLLGILMRRRFRAGHWKMLRVIEVGPLTPDASASAGSGPPSSAAGRA